MTRQKLLKNRSVALLQRPPRSARTKKPKQCKPDRHQWYVASCLPMGIAQVDGWYEVLLTRQCRLCAAFECWSGEQRLQDRMLRQMSVAGLPPLEQPPSHNTRRKLDELRNLDDAAGL